MQKGKIVCAVFVMYNMFEVFDKVENPRRLQSKILTWKSVRVAFEVMLN